MTDPAHRPNPYAMNIAFAYDTAPAIGAVVEIAADRKVAAPAAAGSLKLLGTVVTVRSSLKECTVRTRFNDNRVDRVSGAAIAIGPFVWGSDGKIYAYNDVTHDSAAIAGLVLVAAAGADETVETLEY